MLQHQTVDVGQLLDEGHWGNRQKLFVLLTALTIVFDGVDNQLLGIAVPAMMRDWAVRARRLRSRVASGMVGMMLGGALAGVIGDRMGRRVALIGSVLIFGVLTAAVALVDNLLPSPPCGSLPVSASAAPCPTPPRSPPSTSHASTGHSPSP